MKAVAIVGCSDWSALADSSCDWSKCAAGSMGRGKASPKEAGSNEAILLRVG